MPVGLKTEGKKRGYEVGCSQGDAGALLEGHLDWEAYLHHGWPAPGQPGYQASGMLAAATIRIVIASILTASSPAAAAWIAAACPKPILLHTAVRWRGGGVGSVRRERDGGGAGAATGEWSGSGQSSPCFVRGRFVPAQAPGPRSLGPPTSGLSHLAGFRL